MAVKDELKAIADSVKERRQSTLDAALERRAQVWRALAALGFVDNENKMTIGRLGRNETIVNDMRKFNERYFPGLDFEALLAGETVELDDIVFGFERGTTIAGRKISSLEEYLELANTIAENIPQRFADTIPDLSALAELANFSSVQEAFDDIDIATSEIQFYEDEIDKLESGDTATVVQAVTSVELDSAEMQALQELGRVEGGTAYTSADVALRRAIRDALSTVEPVTPEDEDADRKFLTPPAAPEVEEEKPEGAVHPLYGRDTTGPERPAAVHPLYGEDRTTEQVEFDTVAGMSSAFIEARDAAGDFVVGLTEDGRAVRPDDASAVRTIRLDELFLQRDIDETTDEGILEIQRLTKLTDWYNDNSAYTRTFIEDWINNPSEADRREMLKLTIGNIEGVLRDIGQIGNFTDEDIFNMAYEIQSVNDHYDPTLLRRAVIAEVEYSLDQSATSATAQSANDLQSLARKYFVTLSDEKAADYAMQIYGGTLSESQLEMMFRDQATSRFPTLSNYLSDGFTVADYFASYEAEMEQMLDRPVDLYTEFPQVFDYVTDTGEQRPMTFGEMREFARRMPEWQQSQQGQDQARNISFALAQMFGQAA